MRQLALGEQHTCALLSSGSVRCWGANDSGQLGYGDTLSRTRPGPVLAGLGPVASLAAGASHTCAVLSPVGGAVGGAGGFGGLAGLGDGTVRCWGDNSSGQLGYGDTLNRTSPGPALSGVRVPVPVRTMVYPLQLPASNVVAGAAHTCAVLSSRGLSCWGDNSKGQLGYGDTTTRTSPGPALLAPFGPPLQPPFSGVWALAAGLQHTCAQRYETRISGRPSVICWGDNSKGQLGYGDTTNRTSPGRPVPGLSGGVVAGGAHTCASPRKVDCWGDNSAGQLGYGDLMNRASPGGPIGFLPPPRP